MMQQYKYGPQLENAYESYPVASKDRRKWVLQTTSTSSQRMLRFRYRGNQASSVVDCMKCGSSG